jgi:hypothetical protein
MHAETLPLAASQPAAPRAGLYVVDLLLRDPARLIAQIRAEEGLATIARSMIASILLGGAAFGATLGAYRGGVQILYAGVKLPLVLLFAACLCTPVLRGLGRALGRQSSFGQDAALLLSALSLGALVLAALAPVMLFAGMVEFPYHQTILLACGCCAISGVVGISLLWRGLSDGPGRLWILLGLFFAASAAGAQLSWTLRPFLVRPRTIDIPFVRQLEGSFLESVSNSYDSAQGRYRMAIEELESTQHGPWDQDDYHP